MKNEVAQKDFDMPQLRQMVLDNAKRIPRTFVSAIIFPCFGIAKNPKACIFIDG